MKRRKLRQARPKALFGEVAAAGITAAATLAAAGIGAAATAKAAKEQADASLKGAQQQAQSIEQTNINNNQLQQQSQDFIRSENEANRQIQRDLQMNLQMQAGQLDAEQRRAASRIQVEKGGKFKSRKPLRDAYLPVQGSNIEIQSKDGGFNQFIGYSPEGYPLLKPIGRKHWQKHKVNGKLVGGIGEYIPGFGEIEVEGDEIIADRRMSPHGDVAIASNRKMGTVYPARAIEAGAPVDPVISEQEATKNKKTSPVERNRYYFGGALPFILPTGYPAQDLGEAMTIPNILASRRSMKKGGRCKAALGYIAGWNPNWVSPTNAGLYINPTLSGRTGTDIQGTWNLAGQKYGQKAKWYDGISGNLWGAGITSLGNLGGAWLTSWGANRASKYLSKAYTDRAEMFANAYDKLQTVDMSSIKREDFNNAHYMPVVRSSTYNVAPQLESTNREFRRLMRATNANTLSSAARFNRLAAGSDYASQKKSQIYADKANREEATKQDINKQINEAAARNAELDIQSSRDFTQHYIDLLKYNNDIVNERITGRAQALSDGLLGAAGARANASQVTGQSFGNAVSSVGQAFGNAFATDVAQRNNIEMARLSASRTGELSYLKRFGTQEEMSNEINRLYGIIGDKSLPETVRQNAQIELNYLSSNIYENTNLYRKIKNNFGLSGSLSRGIAIAKGLN